MINSIFICFSPYAFISLRLSSCTHTAAAQRANMCVCICVNLLSICCNYAHTRATSSCTEDKQILYMRGSEREKRGKLETEREREREIVFSFCYLLFFIISPTTTNNNTENRERERESLVSGTFMHTTKLTCLRTTHASKAY